VEFHLPTLWADGAAYEHSHRRRSLQRRIVALRVVAIAICGVLVFVICRVLNALPWPGDAALAALSALWFAYRFERNA